MGETKGRRRRREGGGKKNDKGVVRGVFRVGGGYKGYVAKLVVEEYVISCYMIHSLKDREERRKMIIQGKENRYYSIWISRRAPLQ